MLTYCFIGYLKLTNVRNVPLQPQCVIDDNVQHNGTLLRFAGAITAEEISMLCLTSQSVRGFLVHTVFFNSHCRLKSSGFKSGDLGGYITFLFAPSVFHSAKFDDCWFYRHQSDESIAMWISWRLREDL
jgi:hypothetical protein